MKLKVMEKEQTITSIQKQIEDLKRRAETGGRPMVASNDRRIILLCKKPEKV